MVTVSESSGIQLRLATKEFKAYDATTAGHNRLQIDLLRCFVSPLAPRFQPQCHSRSTRSQPRQCATFLRPVVAGRQSQVVPPVSYTHLTLPTIYSV